MRSIHTESNIQIRFLLDKIVKGEVDIRAGDNVKKDLQQAPVEAQSLAVSKQELSAQIQRATQELKKVHSDVKNIPDLQPELDSLVQERQRLRATFEYENNLECQQESKCTKSVCGENNISSADADGRTHGQMAAGQVEECMIPIDDNNGITAINGVGVSGSLWSNPCQEGDPASCRPYRKNPN
ncbi:Protein FLX-like 2, partial [Mucuna pruriens]